MTTDIQTAVIRHNKEKAKKEGRVGEFTEGLRKASIAVFLATEESVAKDISNRLVGAAEHIEVLDQRIKELDRAVLEAEAQLREEQKSVNELSLASQELEAENARLNKDRFEKIEVVKILYLELAALEQENIVLKDLMKMDTEKRGVLTSTP